MQNCARQFGMAGLCNYPIVNYNNKHNDKTNYIHIISSILGIGTAGANRRKKMVPIIMTQYQ